MNPDVRAALAWAAFGWWVLALDTIAECVSAVVDENVSRTALMSISATAALIVATWLTSVWKANR